VWALLEQYNKLFCSRQKPSLTLHEFFTEYVSLSDSQAKESMDTDDRGCDSNPATEVNKNIAAKSKSSALFQSPVNSKKSTSQTPGRSNWLEKLETTKAQWTAYKPENSMDDFDFGGKQNLNDDQISALLEDSESMDFESQDSGAGATRADAEKEKPAEALMSVKTDLKDDTGTKSPVFSKRPKPGVQDMESGDAGSSRLPTGVPKQKRQMTLKDFYKPI
jgi:hypothetical protein